MTSTHDSARRWMARDRLVASMETISQLFVLSKEGVAVMMAVSLWVRLKTQPLLCNKFCLRLEAQESGPKIKA